MNEKILQIIPAPADMWATYEDEQTGKISRDRVVCLALVEWADGTRSVEAMVHGELGCFYPTGNFYDVLGIEYGEA